MEFSVGTRLQTTFRVAGMGVAPEAEGTSATAICRTSAAFAPNVAGDVGVKLIKPTALQVPEPTALELQEGTSLASEWRDSSVESVRSCTS